MRYMLDKNGYYTLNVNDKVVFSDEKTFNYVVGEHGPEISKYLLVLAKQDPTLYIRRKGRKVIIGRKEEPVKSFGDVETLERAVMRSFLGNSSADRVVGD